MFSQKKSFLIFQEIETPKDDLCISGNETFAGFLSKSVKL